MPSEELEKFRIIETKQTYRPSIRDWLIGNFDNASWNECRLFIYSFCPPGDEMADLLRNIRQWEAEGRKPSQIIETPTGNLQDDLLLAAAQYRSSRDNLSWVGSIVSPVERGESFPWSLLGRNFFLSPFNEKGVSGGFLTITGKPRMGKTGIACHYAEMWLLEYPGTEVLTNIPLEKATAGVRPISDPIRLLHGIADALKAERRWLWAFDEPALSGWMKADAGTSKAKNLERFARIVPKLGGSFVYIEQRTEGVPTIIQDFSQSHIICNSPGFIYADLPGQSTAVRSVPKPSRIEYRTGEAGYFEIPPEFPWDGLFRVLRYNPDLLIIEAASATTQGDRIEKFLSKLEIEEGPKPKVTCRFCGESWIRRGTEPIRQCPRCRKIDPLGTETIPADPVVAEIEAF